MHHVRAATPTPIEALSDDDIARDYDDEAAAALRALQVGRGTGATRFVFVLPVGGGVTTAAATEAVRLLALSAARQWVDDGVTVNCVVASGDNTAIVDFLTSEAAAHVSGQTIRAGGPVPGL